ncbi:hypothetical protein [Thalassotalea eurytherma]|uniref:Secreted protein n=1 Tax=Thalassotalea eurytherma TaxID=1144278 RepID=A0ABQ6H596_9GAMM|nr:hypothetical protein [Thalassotalea eurytherma]GLX82669.1 hypothetical protein theurythT_21210 [Thalassotalea eurytherma]
MNNRLLTLASVSLLSLNTAIADVDVPIAAAQQSFFNNLQQYCGKAFLGKIKTDTPKSDGFSEKLVMHVRYCDENQIQIPFHVGDDSSRTWIITKTHAGLMLKHDHRHKDGSEDTLTMYGGLTEDEGFAQVQSFPADSYTKQLFVKQGIPQSNDNTWQFFLYPERFSYRMIRLAREFQVDFDLSQPITAPKAPWGYED